MPKRKLQVGDWVQSHFRNMWYGRILEIIPRKNCSDLAHVQPLFSASHRKLRKIKSRYISVQWLTLCEPQGDQK